MKVNRKSLLKILSLGLVFALMTVFLFFAGCANNSSPAGNEKSGAEYENPEASEYGLFTKLTLTLDCGDGKVWATVKNTFTVLPSAVRVSVELYKSESYKPDYKEMELASENSAEDLDIFQTITTEAPTGGKTYFWQARMYYRIDNGAWREQLTKVMAINSEGKIVTTDIPTENLPTHEEFVGGDFCIKDFIQGKPNNITVYKPEVLDLNFGKYDEFGNSLEKDLIIAGSEGKEIESKQDIDYLYDIFSSVTFELKYHALFPQSLGNYSVEMEFDNCFIRLYILDNVNSGKGRLCGGWYRSDTPDRGLLTDLHSIDYEALFDYIDELFES